jgi:D-beta-D-heptose 7-phosphate kinase/D-beta-D-heptose 1-phosphate adenosyltransferase
VSVLTPNVAEASFAFGLRIRDEATLAEVGWGLLDRLESRSLLITRGEHGMSLFESGGRRTDLPAVAHEVYDVTGAGDTVVSMFAAALASGADFPEAALLSDYAAGLVVTELGTATVTRSAVSRSLREGAAGGGPGWGRG